MWEMCWMTGEVQCSFEGKIWFCMNFLAQGPRFPSMSQEQSKEKLLKYCSNNSSNELLEAMLYLGRCENKVT